MSSNANEKNGFGNIGISFSGGGHRAAAFHLGSLDLLQQVGLLPTVTMLSTVSGGTITGAKYVCALAASIQNNDPNFYENFFDELSYFLLKIRLPDLWIEGLNNGNDPDSPSLIAVAAKVYHNKIFNRTKFNLLLECQSKLHLEEIIFNTTELRTGNDFRFQVGRGGLIGNGNLPIPRELLENIRIADVVAASSCFPGGFEPLIFPNDFFDSQEDRQKLFGEISAGLQAQEQQLDAKDKSKQNIQNILRTIRLIDQEPLPLVDAGIYDNLGVESILLANNRLKKAKLFNQQVNTLIISDTDNIGLSPDPLKANEQQSLLKVQPALKGNLITRLQIKHLFLLVRFLLLTFAMSTFLFFGSALFDLVQSRPFGLEFPLKIWGGIISAGITFVISKVEEIFLMVASIADDDAPQSENNFVKAAKAVIVDWRILIKSLGDLSIVDILNLLSHRVGSIPSLFLAFLKGQRRKSYAYIQALKRIDRSGSSIADDSSLKTINNYILEVYHQQKHTEPRNNPDHAKSLESLIPSPEMGSISLRSGQMPTTLWFDTDQETAKQQFNGLIACGQFTLCLKLLEMIEEMRDNQGNLSPDMQIIRHKLITAWVQFKEDPHAWAGVDRSQSLATYRINIS
jgi:Patatin-like phospholipase